MLQIGATFLLQIMSNVVTKWGSFIITNWSERCYSYYKLEEPLLQIRSAFTNWGKIYCKLVQVLRIAAISTNCSITVSI